MKRHSFRLAAAALGLLLVLPTGLPASAASSFDAGYYATHYPDVAAACGTDEGALLQHYIQFGASEGRKPSAWGRAGDTDLKLTDTQIAAIWSPVPIKELANYKSLKRKMTDDEFAQAYEQARRIVTPLAFKSREEQLAGIANALREMVDDGTVAYSTDVPHYNDAYGYLVLHVASCAGCARTTGLCLNMLGIPYEHVNENQWSHQWCRVPMPDGSYWICDAYGLYCGPEPAPYPHPYLSICAQNGEDEPERFFPAIFLFSGPISLDLQYMRLVQKALAAVQKVTKRYGFAGSF